ncbi:MAG: hypothetical protein ACO222_07555 [Polynucleobacter sp.]
MELILNQFVKKAAAKSGRSSPKLGAKRLIKRSAGLAIAKKSQQSLGKTITRSTRPATKLMLRAAKGLGRLATLILIGRL